MKRTLYLLLTLCLAFVMCSCGDAPDKKDNTSTQSELTKSEIDALIGEIEHKAYFERFIPGNDTTDDTPEEDFEIVLDGKTIPVKIGGQIVSSTIFSTDKKADRGEENEVFKALDREYPITYKELFQTKIPDERLNTINHNKTTTKYKSSLPKNNTTIQVCNETGLIYQFEANPPIDESRLNSAMSENDAEVIIKKYAEELLGPELLSELNVPDTYAISWKYAKSSSGVTYKEFMTQFSIRFHDLKFDSITFKIRNDGELIEYGCYNLLVYELYKNIITKERLDYAKKIAAAVYDELDIDISSMNKFAEKIDIDRDGVPIYYVSYKDAEENQARVWVRIV